MAAVAAASWHRSQNDAVDVVVAVENRFICHKCRQSRPCQLALIGSNGGNGKFCARFASRKMLRCADARGLSAPNPYNFAHRHHKGCKGQMGYILEEHFVTLWRGWH